MIDQDLLNQVVDCTFTLDLASVVLTRLGSSATETRRGMGTITITPDGTLSLKVMLSEAVCLEQALNSMFNHVPGTLMEEHEYFSLDARDFKGRRWTCPRLRAKDSLYGDSGLGTMLAELSHIETTNTPFHKHLPHGAWLVTPYSCHLPFDTMEEREKGRFTRTLLTAPISDSATLIARSRDTFTVFQMRSAETFDQKRIDRVMQAISIATGSSIAIACQLRRQTDQEILRINSIDRQPKTITTFLNDHMTREFKDFVQRYLKLCESSPNHYYAYWRNALGAWQSGILLAALPISVFIEGLIRDFFADLMHEGDATSQAIDAVVKHCKDAAVDEEILNRCVKAIERMKGKSVTTALKTLASRGWFDPLLVQAWASVRHKSAHGATIAKAQDRENLQTAVEGVMSCLHLFYVLLLIRMDYPGEFIDISIPGHPRTKLALAAAQTST